MGLLAVSTRPGHGAEPRAEEDTLIAARS